MRKVGSLGGGNDADDEADEEDAVFAHVVIGSGSISADEQVRGKDV